MDQVKNRLELDKQSLVSDLEQAVETLRNNAERIQLLEKSWGESEWYLGETKARNQRLEDELRDKDFYIRRMEDDRMKVMKELEECKWYMEEERERRKQLECALADAKSRCQDLEAQIAVLKKQL
jgi:chromosome segregation ATPase